MKIFIVSASMGAGHDGAARELVHRLEREGHETRLVDFLTAMPLRTGSMLRTSYEWQLRLAPWSYEATYRLWYLLPILCRPVIAVMALLTNRRLRRWIADADADVVVSTYPLASLALGRARQRGSLDVPVITFITDFAVHPLWTSPSVDLHLCVHPQSAAVAAERSGRPAAAPGPLVPERFQTALPDRDGSRAALGIAPDERTVLLVAGSWGIGDMERTFAEIVDTGRYVPLAVCGRNQRLRRRLEARGVGHVIGWTDEMPALMAAADVLVENAGGLTCMEAFAAGLPVVSFRPIAGHGRENAAEMARAGVAAFVPDSQSLAAVLDDVTGPGGAQLVAAGRAMYAGDAADDVVELAGRAAPTPRPEPVRARRPRIAAAAACVVALYGVLTLGVDTATAHGLWVTRAPRRTAAAYVAVRLGQRALDDPALAAQLASNHITALVDGSVALEDPQGVQRLVAAGVDIGNSGWGHHNRVQFSRARADLVRASHAIRAATGTPVQLFMPCRRIDGFDLASARLVHERVIVPTRVVHDALPSHLRARGIYLVDARPYDSATTLRVVHHLQAALAQSHIPSSTLAHLVT